MTTLFDSFKTIIFPSTAGTTSRALALGRCWPVSGDHLLLEYRSADGDLIPGQWHADEARRAGLITGMRTLTPESVPVVQTEQGHVVVLQPHGVDPALPQLHPVLQHDSMRLISHRPAKRAVVRQQLANEIRFHKFYASSKAFKRALAQASCIDTYRDQGIQVACVLASDAATGCIQYQALKGTSLFSLLTMGWQEIAVARALGSSLRSMHNWSIPAGLPCHDSAREAEVIRHWLSILALYFPELARSLRSVAETKVFQRLNCVSAKPGVLHRDLHDKQIFLSSAGQPGLIDFDTLACGPAVLDLANLLAHLEFRVLQGKATPHQALSLGQGLVEGYGSDVVQHDLGAFLDATRLRLACVYAFRPRWRTASHQIAAQIGRPFCALCSP